MINEHNRICSEIRRTYMQQLYPRVTKEAAKSKRKVYRIC
jgi:hypothetical protein